MTAAGSLRLYRPATIAAAPTGRNGSPPAALLLTIRPNLKVRIKALKFRGVAHHFQGDFAAAIADFSAVLALDPNDFEALSDRGLAYQALGDSDRALADDDKAVAVNPKFAFAYFNRAIVEDLK